MSNNLRSTVLVALVIALSGIAAAQSVEAYIPNNTPLLTSTNTIPFSGSNTQYTYVGKIPATLLPLTHRSVQDVAFIPSGTGTWSSPTVRIALGHLPSALPCPFTFPTPSTPGSFLDLTTVYDSATQGTFTWPLTLNMWSPMGLGGTPFVWDGVNDVGFYITFQGATQVGFTTGFRPGSGAVQPATRTYAASYQAVTSTACNTTSALYIRLTMIPSTGLFANFGGSPTSGPAPLNVNFTDASTTSEPTGLTSWNWDINNDGIDDYFTQNPSHVYGCPGIYSVRLTVNDGINPQSTYLRTNYVNVGPYVFNATTSGGGVGDLSITPVPSGCTPSAVEGYTLISASTTVGVPGGGPFLGLFPDALTLAFVLAPAAPGNVVHFVVNGMNYPDAGTIVFPAPQFASLNGVTLDAVQVFLNSTRQIVLVSNVDQVTF